VASRADGGEIAVLAGGAHTCHHVGRIAAAGDRARLAVDHSVPDCSCDIVGLTPRFEEFALQLAAECVMRHGWISG